MASTAPSSKTKTQPPDGKHDSSYSPILFSKNKPPPLDSKHTQTYTTTIATHTGTPVMARLSTVQPDYRKPGDEIQVFDDFNGNDNFQYTGEITRITKTFITVKHPHGHTTRFQRKNGQQTGYSFPGSCHVIAPESPKPV